MCFVNIYIQITIYIALQNVDFDVLQKLSPHILISIFFPSGEGEHPLPVPPSTRHFVPQTKALPLFIAIHAPPPPFHQILDPPLDHYVTLSSMWYSFHFILLLNPGFCALAMTLYYCI